MRNILAKPKHGWSNLLNNEKLRISYIDNAPLDLLENAYYSLKNCVPFVITYDAEGYEWTLFSSNLIDLYIYVKDNDDIKTINEVELCSSKLELLPYKFRNFLTFILDDIKANLDEWSCFPASIEITREETKKMNEVLEQKKKLQNVMHNIYIELGIDSYSRPAIINIDFECNCSKSYRNLLRSMDKNSRIPYIVKLKDRTFMIYPFDNFETDIIDLDKKDYCFSILKNFNNLIENETELFKTLLLSI